MKYNKVIFQKLNIRYMMTLDLVLPYSTEINL